MPRGLEEGRIVRASDREDVVHHPGEFHAAVSLTAAVAGRSRRLGTVTTERVLERNQVRYFRQRAPWPLAVAVPRRQSYVRCCVRVQVGQGPTTSSRHRTGAGWHHRHGGPFSVAVSASRVRAAHANSSRVRARHWADRCSRVTSSRSERSIPCRPRTR